jgi:hypothetical protein
MDCIGRSPAKNLCRWWHDNNTHLARPPLDEHTARVDQDGIDRYWRTFCLDSVRE